MANIDTSAIENFDTMTAEQKLEALLKVEIPDKVDKSKYILKTTFDKTASELSQAKKDLASKRTEEENKELEDKQKFDDLQSKYDELMKSSTISQHKANFLAMGYEEKLAQETAEALYNGEMDKVFANQKTFNEAKEMELRAKLVKGDPKPGGGGADDDGKTEAEKLAESLAKSRADSQKSASDALKNYFS